MNQLNKLKEAHKVFIEYINDNTDSDLTKVTSDYSPTGTLKDGWDFYHSVNGHINGKYFSITFKKLEMCESGICISRCVSYGCIGGLRKILKNYKDLVD